MSQCADVSSGAGSAAFRNCDFALPDLQQTRDPSCSVATVPGTAAIGWRFKMNITATEPVAPAPIEAGSRIRGLDALRGVALLGILLANVRQMLLPWDIGNFPVSLGGSERLAWLDWQVFHALVDLKFLTLFSLLFGVGFALQGERLLARGEGFAGVYLRRVFILALLGVAHGLLLYPAEVLMPYAVAGLLLLLAAQKLSADNMFRVGLVLLGATALWGYQLGSLGRVHLGISALAVALLVLTAIVSWRRNWLLALGLCAAIVSVAAAIMTWPLHGGAVTAGIANEYHDAQQQLAAMMTGDAVHWSNEVLARHEGGFAALVRLHASQYSAILFYFAIMLLWRTLGLFMIGAGLFRSGALTRATPAVWSRVAAVGLGTGLPLSVLATWLHTQEIRGEIDWRWPEILHALSALPLAAGIAGTVLVWFERQSRSWLWTRLEAAGRMALSNYIGQSFVMAALAEPWGLSLYGRLGGPALTLLALTVFTLLALLSHAWLERYRMGPLEWLWRCGTYWRWLPNRKLRSDDPAGAPAGTAKLSRTRAPR